MKLKMEGKTIEQLMNSQSNFTTVHSERVKTFNELLKESRSIKTCGHCQA